MNILMPVFPSVFISEVICAFFSELLSFSCLQGCTSLNSGLGNLYLLVAIIQGFSFLEGFIGLP